MKRKSYDSSFKSEAVKLAKETSVKESVVGFRNTVKYDKELDKGE